MSQNKKEKLDFSKLTPEEMKIVIKLGLYSPAKVKEKEKRVKIIENFSYCQLCKSVKKEYFLLSKTEGIRLTQEEVMEIPNADFETRRDQMSQCENCKKNLLEYSKEALIEVILENATYRRKFSL